MDHFVENLNNYAMALLTITVAVSSVLRLLGQAEKPWAKPIVALCFDVGGAIMGAKKGLAEARGGAENAK